MSVSVFVFNPFAEGYIGRGNAFTPVKHQAMLAKDLANLPQFLSGPGDIVLLSKRPSAAFLRYLHGAGFGAPHFLELTEGRNDVADCLRHRKLDSFRPWAWAPDSVELFEPLFGQLVAGKARRAREYFNDNIAQLYSKAWGAEFLRKVLARCSRLVDFAAASESWLCSGQEAGVAVNTLRDALKLIDAIRSRGHHKVVVKEAFGVAGHNAIRLWEPNMMPAQAQWLRHALESGQPLVVEPWLQRELDFSVQLEMEAAGLKLIGYTGLINDRKGQFMANWAEPDYARSLPEKAAALFGEHAGTVLHFYLHIFELLETELRRVGFLGPISIDVLIYRKAHEDACRLKPIVEINPRYTMGRLTLELMKHACPKTTGFFRLVSRAQARAEGLADFRGYARAFAHRAGLRIDAEGVPKIRQGGICLNDPEQAQVCLATFEVSPTLPLPNSFQVQQEHQPG